MAYYVIVCRDCGRNRIGGYGIGGTAGFFDRIGLRPGRLHAWAAAFAETVGGILLA
jgi:putative oxidoreductase